MKRNFIIITLFFFLFLPKENFSTHIVGGEIFYDDLGGGNYKIGMKVYRDCFNGIPPLDGLIDGSGNITSPYFTVFDASFNVIQMYTFPAPAHSIIPPSLNNPCFSPPGGICVEEGIYEMTINLPSKAGGYYIAYQRCCRNNSILNLIGPGNVGTTYWEHIPGPEVVATNSCPRFNRFPPIFICNGYQINFDHSATDPDGDSVAYKLCDPFDGLSSTCPVVGASGCPTNNTPPPYSTVPFLSPYNASYPLSSNPAINIDVHTGWLSGIPNLNGQWVVGICVEEWRNGVLIGTHHRDFQFNVVPCPGLIVSSIMSQTTHCFGYSVNFHNQSSNGTSYLWNFGDPTTTADTSRVFEPSYTYPDTGHYTVTLIVNPYTICADTSVRTFEIYPLLSPSFIEPAAQCIVGNSFDFTAGGTFVGNGTFSWTFGAVASPSASQVQNPNNIVYSQPGTFPVGLFISENGCTANYVDSVTVYPIPEADFNSTPVVGCVPYFMQFYDSSVTGTPASYLWNFGDGTTSTLPSPSHIYNNVGIYNISLTIVTVAGCVATNTFNVPAMVTTQPSPVADFSALPTETSIFEPWIWYTDLSSGGAISWQYLFGDGTADTTTNPFHIYSDPGTYNVEQIVMNQYGCTDTAYLPIKIDMEYRFWIPNAFTPFNNDGTNDVFKPEVFGVEDYEFLVFDRWGELIFETREPKKGWDGTYKGHKCQIDVYVWKISYKDLVEKQAHSHIGHVTLVR